MTAQSMEIIYVEGRRHYMASEPFGDYLETLEGAPTFSPPDTACWRGYYGKWKIEDNKLYLTGLEGFISTPDNQYKEIDLNYFFPDQKKVFAEWFTGEIRIPMGEMIEYIHMGYHSKYERDLIIRIENGLVISKNEIKNT